MGRQPKPYRKGKNFCTSIGGRKHHVLCQISEGIAAANIALNRLIIQDEEERLRARTPHSVGETDEHHAANGKFHGSPLVATAIEEFMDHKVANKRQGTSKWYLKNLSLFRERYGLRQVHSISLADANAFKDYLLHESVNQRTGKKNDYSPATINHRLRSCKVFFAWVCRPSNQPRYQLRFNPFEEVEMLQVRGRERIVTAEEWVALEANVTSGGVRYAAREMKDILCVMRHTTLRPSEVLVMRWEYIDWTKGAERIVIPAEFIKTRDRREALLDEELLPVLRSRRELFDQMGKPKTGLIFSKPGYLDGKRTASASEEGLKITAFATRFGRLVKRCVKKGLIEERVNGEKLVPYSTRHTAITKRFYEGHDPAFIQADAGHTSPLTTERYKHLAGSKVARAMHAKRKGNGAS